MKDGVEYVLRFGSISESRRADTDEGKDGKKQAGDVNRYIFVMAEFNTTAIPRPALEELPGEVEISKSDKDEEKPAEKKPDDAEIEAQREKIEKANQRKLDEYEEKVAEAKAKVNELNARFADWYYVIPNSVYEKIHLGRADIIIKKEPAGKKDAPADVLPPVGGIPPAMLEQLKENAPGEASAVKEE